jgi:hypothetical protein
MFPSDGAGTCSAGVSPARDQRYKQHLDILQRSAIVERHHLLSRSGVIDNGAVAILRAG